ncbi:MAG: hypothetical protein GY772_07655 [bacterium]|jgi:hypothetical protein|nr:hypothetical protein [bacterium]MDP7074720.1 hypothetical protein [Myxococcota bacterium]
MIRIQIPVYWPTLVVMLFCGPAWARIQDVTGSPQSTIETIQKAAEEQQVEAGTRHSALRVL